MQAGGVKGRGTSLGRIVVDEILRRFRTRKQQKDQHKKFFEDDNNETHLAELLLDLVQAYHFANRQGMIDELRYTLSNESLAVQTQELHHGTEYLRRSEWGTVQRYFVSQGVRQGGSEAVALFIIIFNGLLLAGGEAR